VSNPANPVLADYGFDSGEILDVAAGGNDYAYIIYRTEESCHLSEPGFCYPEAGGVGAVDISNPADIVWRKSFETGQRHSQVVVSGSYLYMPPWVFDMSNPTNFVVAGTFSPGVGGLRMVVSGGHIYSAAGSSGLQIASVRPRLFVEPLAGWMQLLWTTNVGNYVLEGTTNPVAPQWDTVNGQAGVSNGFHRVTVPATNPGAYFRLRSIESP
jgi:hypothetical protein